MDLRGLERAVERKSYRYGDREEFTKERLLEQAQHLRRIVEAAYIVPHKRYQINIADLTDSPLGAGRLSATVFEMYGDNWESRSGHFRLEYSFTPATPRHTWHDKSYPEDIHVEEFAVHNVKNQTLSQLNTLSDTVGMLETAIMTDGLDNEDLRARYEALAVDSAAC